MMLTRRDCGRLALLPLASAAFAKPDKSIGGVCLGVQWWSLRDRPLDAAIEAMKEIGLAPCELGFNHIEPAGLSREELRKWRTTVSLDEFGKVRRKFDAAGLIITGYSYPFRDDYSPEEFRRGFEMTRALGTGVLTTTTKLSLVPKLSPLADKYKIKVGLHNHSRLLPDEFARPDDFEAALKGSSPNIGINLDCGHYVAAGFDPIATIEKHHARIFSLHLKDRKKNQGPDMDFGLGDTPIREILLLLKKNKYKIPAMIEWERKGPAPEVVANIRKCVDYCRKVLA